MQTTGLFSLLMGVATIALAVMTIILPFIVLSIRNELVKANQKLSVLIGESQPAKPAVARPIKECPYCGSRDQIEEDAWCMACGANITA